MKYIPASVMVILGLIGIVIGAASQNINTMAIITIVGGICWLLNALRSFLVARRGSATRAKVRAS